MAETAFSTGENTGLWHRLKWENREGIVFKQLDAPYVPCKPNSVGPQLKSIRFYCHANITPDDPQVATGLKLVWENVF